jgi:Rhs element Vgr protein
MPQTRTIPTNPPIASLVTFSIKIEGQAIPRAISVKNLVVYRQVNKIPKLSLTILDGSTSQSNFDISNQDYFVPGKKIEIYAGYNSQEEILFAGIIIKHAIKINVHDTVLLVEAADAAFKMTLNPKRKVFNNISDSELIEEIAASYGIDADIEKSPVSYAELMQYYATDWDYIQTRAEATGKLCFCQNGVLVVKAPALDTTPVLDLVYGATIKELNAEIDSRFQYSGVQGLSWNSADQSLINIEAASPAVNEPGNMNAENLSVVAQEEPVILMHGGNIKEQELQSRIDTQLLKSRLSKIRGTVKISGYAGVMPGQMIKLNGVGDRFAGNSFVSGVRHEIGNGLWDTIIQFGINHKWFAEENDIQPMPAAGFTPSVKGLQIGIVTNLENDPEGEHRIKVKIPVIDKDGEGLWCKMAMPDAGNNRGFYFRPEIGDEVVIGFLSEDPNYGIVLGCLHSSAKPAPLSASNDNHEKGMVTRSQMKWIWNDDKKTLTIETPAGNRVLISDDEKEISLKDEHGNSIQMNGDGITIQSSKDIILKAAADMTIEAGTNVEVNAGASLKASGSAQAELSSSGTTTIKGSMVMIN